MESPEQSMQEIIYAIFDEQYDRQQHSVLDRVRLKIAAAKPHRHFNVIIFVMPIRIWQISA